MKSLSREEMKNIFGGVAAAPNCKSGTKCTVRTLNDDWNIASSSTGTCQMTTSGASVTCYCQVAGGGTSNTNAGGLSHCWA